MSEHIVHPGEQLITDLQTWAQEYADSSEGRMQVLPYEPGVYPGQDGFSVEGEPNAAAVVDSIATVAQPRYPELLGLLHEQEEQTSRVSMIGELLNGGNNVILTTNHSDLIDIAIAQAAVYSTLRHQGYEMETSIIISKMVAFLGYKLGEDFAPAAEVLKLLETETFLSYPKTESTKKHLKDRILPNEIDKHNRDMRRGVIHRLGQGGLLLAMAASGTTDKPKPETPAVMQMGRLGNGTLDLMMQPKTYVAPMAIWYKDDQAVMELADIPRVMLDEEYAHKAMGKIALTLSAKVPTHDFVYES